MRMNSDKIFEVIHKINNCKLKGHFVFSIVKNYFIPEKMLCSFYIEIFILNQIFMLYYNLP